ncbi:unnamed protein product [Peniophora sp. CBMAI 1063]|nr:unnamed protein product [Peniophora sp. CBMAI 1063]
MPENDSDKPRYAKPEDFLWDTYLKASKDEDEARPENWEGSTTGILTFTGLFAATVAAFIVESYKLLSVDSGDQTVQLLSQLLVATANASSGLPVVITAPEPFSTPPAAIATNALWFMSLFISLVCALLSTLVQEWSRAYVQDINRRKVLHESMRERAFNHIYIRMGVNRYGMDQFVSWIVALVHLAVFLFACGLLVFLFPIDHIVAGIATAIFGVFVIIYGIASLLPLLDKSCPYRTPVTYLLAFAYWSVFRSRIGGVFLSLRKKGTNRDQTTLYALITRHQLEKNIVISEDDRTSIPSPEFVGILRLAGLDEWLEPGSAFNTKLRNDPNHKFLSAFPGTVCVEILRELAKRVNFETYFERAAAARRPPLTLPILGTDNSSEHPRLAQPGADVSDDTEPAPPRSARISTMDALNVKGVRDLPADSEHGAFALAAGDLDDAATGSYGNPHERPGGAVDPVELEQGPATMTAAQLLGERGEDETNGAGANELEMVTIVHDRDGHTENREASDEAAMDERESVDVGMAARPRSGAHDTDNGVGRDELSRAGAPELDMVTVDSRDRDAHKADQGTNEAPEIDEGARADVDMDSRPRNNGLQAMDDT